MHDGFKKKKSNDMIPIYSSLYVHLVWLGGGAGLHVCRPVEVYSTVAGSQPPAQRHAPPFLGRLLSEHAQSAAAAGAKRPQEVNTHTYITVFYLKEKKKKKDHQAYCPSGT